MSDRSPLLKFRDNNLSLRIDRKQKWARRIEAKTIGQGPFLLAERMRQNLGIPIRAVNATVVMLVKPKDR